MSARAKRKKAAALLVQSVRAIERKKGVVQVNPERLRLELLKEKKSRRHR